MACSSDTITSSCSACLGLSASASMDLSPLAVTAAQAETLQRLADVLWSTPSSSVHSSNAVHGCRVSIDMGSLAHGGSDQYSLATAWPTDAAQQAYDPMTDCRTSLSAHDLAAFAQSSTGSPFSLHASTSMRPPAQRASLDYSAVSSVSGAFSGPSMSDSLGLLSSYDINNLGSYANSSYPSSLAGSTTDAAAPLDASTMALLAMQHQQHAHELLHTRAQVAELQQQLETLHALTLGPQVAVPAAAAAPVSASRRRNSVCIMQPNAEPSGDQRRHSISIPRYPVARSLGGSPAGSRLPSRAAVDPMAATARPSNAIFQSSLYAPAVDTTVTTHGTADAVFQSALYAPVTRISEETGMVTTASSTAYQSSPYAPAGPAAAANNASAATAAVYSSSLYGPTPPAATPGPAAAAAAAMAYQSALYGAAPGTTESSGHNGLNSSSSANARQSARRNRTWNCPDTTSSMLVDPVVTDIPRRSISFNSANATTAAVAAAAAAAAAAAVAARNSMDMSAGQYSTRTSLDVASPAACMPPPAAGRVSFDLAAAAIAAANASRPGTARRHSIEVNAAAAVAAAVAASRSAAAARASLDMSRPAVAGPARVSIDMERRASGQTSIDVERPPKAAGSDPVPVTSSSSGGVTGWAPKWAGTFWNPLAEVVRSGQIRNKGTGVFLPPGMKVEEEGADEGGEVEGQQGDAKREGKQ